MSPEWGVSALVLLAALLHASWNAMVKMTGDRLLALTAVMATCSLAGLAMAPFVPLPARESWPYLALSLVLHGGYNLMLVAASRVADLSHDYPIARGLAPLGVAVLSALFAGELLGPAQAAALAVISLGIASLAFAQGWPDSAGASALGFATATGVLIGAYSFVDGAGVRVAGHPLSYIAWQFLLAGIPITVVALARRRRRVVPFLRENGVRGVSAGLVAALAYGVVIWAMSLTRMAYVASLRETSVLFAALIGTRLLGEPFGARRVTAAAVVAAGIVLLAATG